jgi:hypothetical protein
MMLRLALLICLAVPSLGAQAIPDAVRGLANNWRESGRGEMRWFGLKLYDAELWLSGSRFDADKAFALNLTYAREFAGARLASRSIDEMQRQARLDPAAATRWLAELARVLPDVKEGEKITGVYLPGRGAAFYHEGRLSGEIADVELARRFFAIWLDPRTREPGLRKQLLGVRE